jgi:NADPH:quinone reductase
MDGRMKAGIYYRNGGADVLQYEEVADPQVGRSDVLIDVQAISIEGGDLLNRRHTAPEHLPHVVGYSAAGIVTSVGADVTRFTAGQRVTAFNWSGSHAELWAVPEKYVFAVPASLDMDTAATVPVAFGTADDALFEFGRLCAGQTVVVRGATGGVGLAAVQLAAARGAKVIVTASEPRRFAELRELGAHHVIDYNNDDVVGSVLDLTAGAGADLVIDMVGGSLLNDLPSAIRYRGALVVVGAASDDPTHVEFSQLVSRSITVAGVSFGQEMHTGRARFIVGHHLVAAADRTLRMPIDARFALADVARAHAHVETGHPFGRVVVHP